MSKIRIILILLTLIFLYSCSKEVEEIKFIKEQSKIKLTYLKIYKKMENLLIFQHYLTFDQ